MATPTHVLSVAVLTLQWQSGCSRAHAVHQVQTPPNWTFSENASQPLTRSENFLPSRGAIGAGYMRELT